MLPLPQVDVYPPQYGILSAFHFTYMEDYPYLSAETSVSPNVVNVTDNVTVTLRLKGDGWALQPNPIDCGPSGHRSNPVVFGLGNR